MSKPNPIIRLFKEPLFLLLLIGACIYGGYQWFQKREPASEQASIRVDSGQIEGMIMQWEKRWNRPPTREEIDGLIQHYVREEILYRQAVAMKLDKNDPITRRRTVQKLEFLTNDIAMSTEPTEAELEQFFAENQAEYRSPDVISFLQVFFNPDERGDSTLEDAKATLEELKKAGAPDPATLKAGDNTLQKTSFPAVTEMDVRRQMGGGFSEPLMKLEPGRWHGPMLSGYGVHLVYVFALQQGEVPALEMVREKVLAAWYDQQREKLSAEMLEGLKKKYEIVIDEVPADRLVTPKADAKVDGAPEGAGS